MEDDLVADAHVEHYCSLHPGQFSSLSRMELRQAETHQVLTLEMEHDTEAARLVLTFVGVVGFEFLPHCFQPVPLDLDVAYIGTRQWQGLNYQVFNTEQGVRLSFYCRDFHAARQEWDHSEPPAA